MFLKEADDAEEAAQLLEARTVQVSAARSTSRCTRWSMGVGLGAVFVLSGLALLVHSITSSETTPQGQSSLQALQTGTSRLFWSSNTGTLVAAPAEDPCYFHAATDYRPYMDSVGRTEEADPDACQDRCTRVPGCAFFAFWDDGGCHLASASATAVVGSNNVVSGPATFAAECDDRVQLVTYLVTLGAPAVAWPQLTAPGNKCIRGLRIYSENRDKQLMGLAGVTASDAAAMVTNYPHVKSPMLVLMKMGEVSRHEPCPGKANWPHSTYPSWLIHRIEVYKDRLVNLKLEMDKLDRKGLKIHLANFTGWTYNDVNQIRADVQKVPGWDIVGYMNKRAIFGDSPEAGEECPTSRVTTSDCDRVLLLQKDDDLKCAIAFEGSDALADFARFGLSYGTGFCGFKNVHVGVRNEVANLIRANGEYPRYIRSRLQNCSAVHCVGHSLGGAICNLFSACANSGRHGDPDYDLLKWTPGVPGRLALGVV